MLKQNVDTHVPNNAVHLKPFGEKLSLLLQSS